VISFKTYVHVYQFLKDVPVLYVETRLRKELEDIREEQRMLEERKIEYHEKTWSAVICRFYVEIYNKV